jgi:hypothetical protein
MPPTPTPTEAQIEKTREVTGENSYDYIEGLIDNLKDSQWARALQLLLDWDEYPAGDTIELAGGREAVNYSSETARGDIRIRLRLLLGLPELRDGTLTGAPGSVALFNHFVY